MVGIYSEVGDLAIDRIGRAKVFKIKNIEDNLNAYNNYGAPGIVNFSHRWERL